MADNIKQNNNIFARVYEPFTALLLVNFTGAIGFSIVLPFLVFLVHQWGGNAIIFATVSATYSIFQLVGSTFMGRMSDYYGRRRMLAMSQMGTVMAWLLVVLAFYLPADSIFSVDTQLLGKFTLTIPLILLFFSRALDGLTGGNASVANAYVADITPADQRDERFGKMGVASNLGAMIGPVIVGVLAGSALGYEMPVLATLAISLISLIITIAVLPKPNSTYKPVAPGLNPHAANALNVLGKEHSPCLKPVQPTPLSNARLMRLPGVAVFMVTYFCVMLAFNFFYVAFPLQAATKLHWTIKHTGAFFSVMSICMVVVQAALLPRLARLWSDKTMVCTGAFVLIFGFLALMPANDWMPFAGAILIAVGNGIMWPPVVALLSKASGDYQGSVMGLAGSISAAASILGLFLGGILYPIVGGWLFVVSAASIAVVVLLSSWYPPDKQTFKASAVAV